MPKALTDADIMKGGLGGTDGGEGDDAAKAAAAAKAKEPPATVNVGGVEFPAEIGDKLQTLVQGFTREIDHLKGQVQTLSTVQKPAAKKDDDDDDDDDINTKLFENPKEAINKVLAKFEKKIARQIEESMGKVDSKHAAEKQEKEFWNLFYTDNPDLKEHDFLARAILTRDFGKLGTKTVDEALKHIATETKKVLLKAGGKPADGAGKSRPVEGAGGRADGKAPPAEDDDAASKAAASETLSGFLKSRRDARRAAGHKEA